MRITFYYGYFLKLNVYVLITQATVAKGDLKLVDLILLYASLVMLDFLSAHRRINLSYI